MPVRSVSIPEGAPGRAVSVEWDDEVRASLDVLWLRDNCPTGGARANAFRTFSVADLDPDLEVAAAHLGADDITVTYSDGHVSRFDPAWLRAHRPAPRPPAPRRLWRALDADLPRIDRSALDADTGHAAMLQAVVEHGAAIVEGVPTTPEGSEELAALLGHVRHTDFGRFFDIVSEPDVWTMSQSTAAMDPHTDDPYRYTPSGISILHCIEASPTGGGASSLVDGFAVAEALRATDPTAFDLLSSIAVPWVRHRADSVDQGEAVHMVAHAPIIRLDRHGDVCGIRFHERSMGTLDLEGDVMGAYYRALIAWTRLIRSPDHQWVHRLTPGEAFVFDNQRVLHGRTAFDGDPGRRHLRLCTVDRDQVHSRLRLLRGRLGTGTADDRLPEGNLS